MGLFDPAWVKNMPLRVRLNKYEIDALEDIRKEFHAPHDVFMGLVVQSPGITKKIFERQFLEYKHDHPRATNKEIFLAILDTRFMSNRISQGFTPEFARSQLQSGQHWLYEMAVESFKDVGDVTRYVIDEIDKFWQNTPDPLSVNSRIAEILGYTR